MSGDMWNNGRRHENRSQYETTDRCTKRAPLPFFEPDQPGGRNDPLLAGLSGAGVKWYRKYLALGDDPIVAREKAEEHRNPNLQKRNSITEQMQDRGEHKKPRRDTVSPDPSTSQQSSTRPMNNVDYAEKLKTLKLTVFPLNYPEESLSQDDLDQLERAIVWELPLALADNVEPHFTGLQFKASMLVIECADQDTMQWVQYTIPKLTKWQGVDLSTREGDSIPVPHIITVFLPRFTEEDEGRVLDLLEAQNRKFHVHTWMVMRERQEQGGLLLTIGIGEQSLKALREANFKVYFRFGVVNARLVGGKDH